MTIPGTITTYHPTGTLDSMEGGPRDRYGRPLVTVEAAQKLGADACYSVACDYTREWYRKDRRVTIDGIPGTGRLCDTGQHFYGKKKVVVYPGREPFDVCCEAGGAFAKSWGRRKRTVTFID